MGKRRPRKGGALRGMLGPSYPSYAPVNNPFHVRFSEPRPTLPDQGIMLRRHRHIVERRRRNRPATSGGLEVSIKGRPLTLYGKGRRVVKVGA